MVPRAITLPPWKKDVIAVFSPAVFSPPGPTFYFQSVCHMPIGGKRSKISSVRTGLGVERFE
jgi:hypothetical protein